ncbi:MAG: MFS transporter [Chloroflexota bacterium]
MFLGAVDQTVVAATLPAIVLDLGLPINRLDDVSWTITAYLAGYALMLPIAGQIADRVRRLDRFVLACLVVFALGSLAVGAGRDLPTIVMGRFIQAVGAGALLPVALGRVVTTGGIMPMISRIGWITAIAEGGALLGPVYGAAAIQLLSWRWVFLLNIPCAVLLGFWLLRKWTPGSPRPDIGPLAWRGAILLGGALSVLTLGVSQEASRLAGGAGRPLLLLTGAALIALLFLSERRAANPLLPRTLLLHRGITATLTTHLLGGAALMVPLLVVPLWGNTLLGLDSSQAALLLARLTLTIPIGALLGSKLGDKMPLSVLASVGMMTTAGALAMMATWTSAVDTGSMTLALLLTGLGFGIMIAPTNATAIHAAGLTHAASVASLVQAARLVGMTLASAGLASYGLDHFNALVADLSIGDAAAYVQAVRASAQQVFTELFRVGALIAALGAVAALAGPSRTGG